MAAAAQTAKDVFGPSREATMRRLEWLTWFTDNSIRIPGTNRTIGADGFASLIPGIGTFIGTGLSLYLVVEAVRHGAGLKTVAKMGGNVVLDTLVGAIPAVGFLFDMAFKANQRNLRLLKRELNARR
jgi:hypothetical protein